MRKILQCLCGLSNCYVDARTGALFLEGKKMKEIVKKSLIWLFYILCLIIIVNYFCESFCFFENIISNNPIKRKVFYTFDFKIIYFAQISSFK